MAVASSRADFLEEIWMLLLRVLVEAAALPVDGDPKLKFFATAYLAIALTARGSERRSLVLKIVGMISFF